MSLPAELRKIQITGGSTYIISLPKKWVRAVGLKPKDQVALIPQADMSLLIVPREELKPKEVSETTIEASAQAGPEAVIRDFIAHYLVGYDIIRIKLRDVRGRDFIKNSIRQKLIGVEVMEESADEIVIQCLLGHVELPLRRALDRMHILMLFMLKDAISALKNNDKALAEEVIRRDDEVDRLYFFIVRQLKAAVYNRVLIEEIGLSNPRDCLGYRLIAKSVERSADHAARIASIIPTITTPMNGKATEALIAMSSLAQEIHENSMKALYKYDSKLIEESMSKIKQVIDLEEEVIEQLLKLKIEPRAMVGIRLILESIRRIAEYGTDIAEIAINLAVKRPS
ncbi:phosphate uptake regulator PhoU [Candidatus Bathyarchaeota archaeon]|nr:MAG: transcriptional regulator [Candidatus Bathyarchaeota archaeon ex4484_40]RJS77830.1 MAG: phosphate uptake regulator PhoU [Candidatus Bathyarchaeota archaeon]HDJ04550.1 phosphate uptake regulator PhoU [Candidatus Bathyarchaeota archaeon]